MASAVETQYFVSPACKSTTPIWTESWNVLRKTQNIASLR